MESEDGYLNKKGSRLCADESSYAISIVSMNTLQLYLYIKALRDIVHIYYCMSATILIPKIKVVGSFPWQVSLLQHSIQHVYYFLCFQSCPWGYLWLDSLARGSFCVT